jgi:SAM-dependent methyltransferase
MPEEHQRLTLRTTFEEVPDLYDRARPSYPPQLFDDLASLASLTEGARVLEIGCGTGKATIALAERAFSVTCVELGANLAERARRNLRGFSGVEIVTADFETWEAPGASFDAVVAFTAFHWIDPAMRYEKSAGLLHEGGALAIVATRHVLPPGGDLFFDDVQEDYRSVLPDENEDDGPPPRPEDVPDLGEEMLATGLLSDVTVRRYSWDVVYTADEYVAVLDTYSEHRALERATRDELYERIHRRIADRPDATVRKSYLATLNLARRSPTQARRSARKG